jgi:Nif-specific regulatory protein
MGPAPSAADSLYEITQLLVSARRLDEVLRVVVAKAAALVGSEAASVALRDEPTGELVFHTVQDPRLGPGQALVETRIPADRGVAGWVLQEGQPAVVPDVTADPRFFGGVDQRTGTRTRSLLCVPLRVRDEAIGVLTAVNKIAGAFDDADVRTATALGASAAIAIENARLIEALTAARERLETENVQLRRAAEGRYDFGGLIGQSEPMRALFALMEKVVPGGLTVLIHGETGTGKELIARAIHHNGPRKDRPFLAQNCGALPDTLLESELFGHRRGAFTGAVADKKGLFEVADSGTVFLDEIGDTSPAMQVKLLRVIQAGEITPLGWHAPRKVDVRIIAATNRDLEAEVQAGRFRQDLYYRVAVFPIRVPPLRERREDIPLLAGAFLERARAKAGKAVGGFSREALKLLMAYGFPGNVRELEAEVERAVALAEPNGTITPGLLSDKLRGAGAGRPALTLPARGSLKARMDGIEREVVLRTLEEHRWNKTKVARALGISRQALQKKLAKHRIK